MPARHRRRSVQQPGKWYGMDAYASKDEARAMLKVYTARGKKHGANVRLRDIRENN